MQLERTAAPVGGWNAYCEWARQISAEAIRAANDKGEKSLSSKTKAGHANGNS